MNKEIWKSIPGFKGFYEASDRGRIRSLYGRVRPLNQPHILKPRPLPNRYLRVQLHRGAGDHYIHRLVALTFIPNPTLLPLVNHIDSNRTHNNAANLEWCTQKQNLAHAVRTGSMRNQAGEGNHAGARLTNEKVLAIRQLYDGKRGSIVRLAREFGVCHQLIGSIIRRKIWTHI